MLHCPELSWIIELLTYTKPFKFVLPLTLRRLEVVSIVPIPKLPNIVEFELPETYKLQVVEVVPTPILFVKSDVVLTLPLTEPPVFNDK